MLKVCENCGFKNPPSKKDCIRCTHRSTLVSKSSDVLKKLLETRDQSTKKDDIEQLHIGAPFGTPLEDLLKKT